MKYFIDFEFIEGFHKPLFGKRRHFIDMISVGIVREDGAEYYAISSEYNYKDASQWVKDNVIRPMYIQNIHRDERNRLDRSNFHKYYGKTNKQISKEIIEFCTFKKLHNDSINHPAQNIWEYEYPEFYGYYSDYDWVLFCSLFGTMMDLPDGFPMHCIDLKQIVDDKFKEHYDIYSDYGRVKFNRSKEFEEWKKSLPRQMDEHNALADAKWNKKLYEFLTR